MLQLIMCAILPALEDDWCRSHIFHFYLLHSLNWVLKKIKRCWICSLWLLSTNYLHCGHCSIYCLYPKSWHHSNRECIEYDPNKDITVGSATLETDSALTRLRPAKLLLLKHADWFTSVSTISCQSSPCNGPRAVPYARNMPQACVATKVTLIIHILV